ncbi:MAG: hypothetical protein SFW35_11855 [Chitinophagales bacterium]|nr:hypothetical protein [Chitinophagales bacterium]
MIGFYISRVFMFIGLVVFQVLVFNNLDFNFYVNPYIYPLFILLLPFNTPQWLLLILAFALGITVDLFSSTPGFHAAALVFMAYCQPLLVRLLTPKTTLETETLPNIRTIGFAWFITYAGILLLLHHIVYFLIEIFSLQNLLLTMAKVLISGLVSMVLIILLAYLFSPEKKRT